MGLAPLGLLESRRSVARWGISRSVALMRTRRQNSLAAPIGPARGSQPGAQAGRHALEGRGNVESRAPLLATKPDRSLGTSERAVYPIYLYYVSANDFVNSMVA